MSKREPKQPPVENLSFEHAMQELEHLVEQIESGEIGLEEAIRRYERGISLIQRCRTVLDSAEQRIAELTTDAEDQFQIDGETELGSEPPEADEAENIE
jgi:exodeoxyribonuclease VII small subunit